MINKLMTALGVVLSISAVNAMNSQIMDSNNLTSNNQMQNLTNTAEGKNLADNERIDRFELINKIKRINQRVYEASINPTLEDISEEEAANEKYIEQLRELVHQDIHAVLAPFSPGDKIDKISSDEVCDLLAQLRCSDLPTSIKLVNWKLQEVPNLVKKMGYVLILSQEPNLNYLMKTEVCRDFGFQVVDGEMYKL